jgi:hypothetical protein
VKYKISLSRCIYHTTILFVYLLSPTKAFCQELWNDTIGLNCYAPIVSSATVSNDKILLYGVCFNNNVEYKQGLVFAQVDSLGHVLHQRVVLDSLGDRLSISDYWGKVIATSDGGYLANAATYNRRSTILIKMNGELEIEFLKEYIDTINSTNFMYKLMETAQGYFLYGSLQLPNLKIIGHIRHTDFEGNITWEKQYDFAQHGTYIVDMEKVTDSTFVMGTAETLVPFTFFQNGSGRAGIYYLDMHGNILSSWKSEPEPAIGYMRNIMVTPEKDLIVAGNQHQTYSPPPLEYPIGQRVLTRISPDFQVQWTKNYGPVGDLEFMDGPFDFVSTPDNCYLGVGNKDVSPSLTSPLPWNGWAYKFKPDGTTDWERDFTSPPPLNSSYSGVLYGAGVLSSGNIVAAGYVAADNGSRFAWVVKLTQEGCMDTLLVCGDASGTHVTVPQQVGALTMAPNPAHDQTVVAFDGPLTDGRVLLFDIYGRNVGVYQLQNGQVVVPTEQLPTGVYFLSCYSGPILLTTQRLMVAH